MRCKSWLRLGTAMSVGVLLACAKGDQASQSADSTARNLTLAPTESSAAMKDVPPPAAPETPKAPPPVKKKAPPPAPTSFTAPAGTSVSAAADESISTRTAKPGNPFTATVGQDVRDRSGHVVIPMGSTVSGTVVHADPAPNPRATGRLELAVTSVTVRGRTYPISGIVESKDSVMEGRGVTAADAAKVGGGAAIGAIAGKIIGKNKKGAVIGGLAGAAAGAAAASRSRDVDVVLPKDAGLVIRLTEPLTVAAK